MRRKMRRFWWTQQNRLLSVLKRQKQHTPKTQLLISLQAGEIIALAFSNGKKHDFQLFKDSGIHVKAETVLEADTGYQGLAQVYAIRFVKRFRILSERYRNRRIRLALRFSLIAGICNFDRFI